MHISILPLSGISTLSGFIPLPNLTSLKPPDKRCPLATCSLGKRSSLSGTHLLTNCRYKIFKTKAASIPESTNAENESQVGVVQILQLGAMFGTWYLLNIYFNIFNKLVLKMFPFPATVSAVQSGCGTFMILTMWTLNLHPRPRLTCSQIAAILPLALAHTLGNLLTNVSLGKVAVSFTHTIKAMEPFFTVLFASLFIGEKPSVWVVSSLVPVVGGVALASCTETSFNWTGFCSAMASNVTNQSRNVLSKKLMVNKDVTVNCTMVASNRSETSNLDNINLFSVITIMSFVLLVPLAIFLEGVKLGPSYLQCAASRGLNVRELIIRCLLSGFCFQSYQQVSYMILQMVNPITHAVGNSVKRVMVIVSSVLIFRTPVSPINSLGTAIALAGVFLYSKAKGIKPEQKVL